MRGRTAQSFDLRDTDVTKKSAQHPGVDARRLTARDASAYTASPFDSKSKMEVITVPVHEKPDVSSPAVKRRAVLIDFDGLALPMRDLKRQALQAVMHLTEKTCSKGIYSRYCVGRSPEEAIASLMEFRGVHDVSARDVAKAMAEKIKEAVATVQPADGLLNLVKGTINKGYACAAYSTLDQTTLDALVERFGLKDAGLHELVSHGGGQAIPTVDMWLRLAKRAGVAPLRCTTVVTGGSACRTALAAHMRCVVIPDEFTAFQDFTGADRVLEQLDATATKTILGIVEE